MELRYVSLEYDAAGAFHDCTEVLFQPHESRTRAKLVERLPKSGVPYDQEVFPEQIILGIHAGARQVHSVITGREVDVTSKRVEVSQSRPSTETVVVKGDIL